MGQGDAAQRRRAKASAGRAGGAALAAYLAVYNLAQAGGWGLALALLGQGWRNGGARAAWEAGGALCYVMQCVAVLEVVHAALGLVKARWSSAALQWVARTNVITLVVAETPEIWGRPAVTIMLAAWALGELVRYPWYALTVLNVCPRALTWLRYTAFIPLYPVGFLGEMVCIVQALPYLQARPRLHAVPLDALVPDSLKAGLAASPLSYHGFMMCMLVYYPIGWFSLYRHMFRQRRNKLGPGAAEGSAAKKRE